jgi:hypothetical protein
MVVLVEEFKYVSQNWVAGVMNQSLLLGKAVIKMFSFRRACKQTLQCSDRLVETSQEGFIERFP